MSFIWPAMLLLLLTIPVGVALYLVRDELVLCLFDAPSREVVKQASERAGMPCERVIDTVWVEP